MMDVNLWIAAFSGFIGAVILLVLIYLLKLFGVELDVPYLIGTRFIDINKKTKVYFIGILLHLLFGALWIVIYVSLMKGLAVTTNWPAGILWGFANGVFSGTMLGILAENHPYIGDGKPMSKPGVMGRKWSAFMPYLILGLHVIFGVCSMAIYYQLVLA